MPAFNIMDDDIIAREGRGGGEKEAYIIVVMHFPVL